MAGGPNCRHAQVRRQQVQIVAAQRKRRSRARRGDGAAAVLALDVLLAWRREAAVAALVGSAAREKTRATLAHRLAQLCESCGFWELSFVAPHS